MNKKIYISIIAFLICTFANGQDIILSQPYTASQFLSPASVGGGVYQQRIQANMRTQMFEGANLYNTVVAGWDTRFKKNDEEQNNYFGIGTSIISDRLIGGLMQTNHFTVNLAYHLFLDDDYYSEIALGLGTTFSQTNIDKSKLVFNDSYDQYSGYYFGTSGDLINLKPFPYKISANTGVMYTRHTPVKFLQISANAFFYGTPDLTTTANPIATRLKAIMYLNMEQVFREANTFMLHASYNNRLSNGDLNRQLIAGAAVSFPMTYDWEQVKRLYVGCMYRVGEAIVPSVSLMVNKYTFGLSYDVYTNSKTGANIRQNGFEISLSTSFGKRRNESLKTIFD